MRVRVCGLWLIGPRGVIALPCIKILSIKIDPKKFLLNRLTRCRAASATRFSLAMNVIASDGLPPKGG